MIRALLLLYYFPPSGGPGVQRGVKLCRYLPEHGVEPVVVTVTPESYSAPGEYAGDASLADELPAGLTVHRTPSGRRLRLERMLLRSRTFRPAQHVCPAWFFERQAGWYAPALAACLEAVERLQPDVLLTSSQPYTAHLVGREVRRRTGLPWVADFRDPWTWAWSREWVSRRAHAWEVEREREVLAEADCVVMNTPGSRRELLERHPWVSATKVGVVRNGYDEADFEVAPATRGDEDLRIVHAGSFRARPPGTAPDALRRLVRSRGYRPVPYDESSHSPGPLLDALARLRARAGAPKVRLRLVGPLADAWRRRIVELGLEEIVDVLGYRAHEESISELLAADLLYLPTLTRHDGLAVSNVPAKTYEYLGSGRPVVALAGPGDVRELLVERPRARVLRPDDPLGLDELLESGPPAATEVDPEDSHGLRRSHGAELMARQLGTARVERGEIR